MSGPNPLIVPKTAADTVPLNVATGDKAIVYITGTWGALEDAAVLLPTSDASTTTLYDNFAGSAVVINATVTSVTLDGGFLYTITKPLTASAAGLDYQIKPRIGPH